MPNQIAPSDLQPVLRAVAQIARPASFSEIYQQLRAIPPRSLRRYLRRLTDEGFLKTEGKRPRTRYIYVHGLSRETRREELLVSRDGQDIRNAVRAPRTEKKPVGYDRVFLESYIPNNTFYLSAELRTHLAKIGGSLAAPMAAGTYARQILDRLLIDLSWNSSRLEGNTYSLLDTERLIKVGEEAEGKNAQEAQMILNHKQAIEFLVDDAAETAFNRHTLLSLHAILSNNLLADPQAGGRLRSIDVGIGESVFNPLVGPQIIEELFDILLQKTAAIEDPFEQSFFVMVQLPYLQPFEDVNKRVSRLAANIPLIRHNLAPLSFLDVPRRDYIDATLGVYELNRTELLGDVYKWAYEQSAARYASVRRSLGEPDPFRLRYRKLLYDTIAEIVRRPMDRREASEFIKWQANTAVSDEDKSRFVDVAETELLSLHEGNFARYRLRPSEFNRWRDRWS